MDADARRKARHARYNASLKVKQRYQRYEAKHPERATRWSVIMHVKARRR